MSEYFAGGHLRFVDGEWRDDDGNVIEVAPVRHGRWIAPFLSDSGNMCAECSNCHRIRIFDDYCSACGAIMDLNDLED